MSDGSDEADDFTLRDYLAGFSDPEARARAWREAGCPQADEHGAVTSLFWDQTLGPQTALAAGLSNHDFREYDRKFRRALQRQQNRIEDHAWKQRFMTIQQAESLHAAISFCNFAKGKLLNAKLTLTWELLGYQTPREAVDAHQRLQNEMGMRLSNWGYEHLYIYVHERTRDLGFHTHVLMNTEYECKKKLRRWLIGHLINNNRPTQATPFKFEPRYPEKKNRHLPWDAAIIRRQWAGYRYLVKGLDPASTVRNGHDPAVLVWKLLGLKKLIGSLTFGEIQRCGGAHALWTAAQRNRQFPRTFHEQQWDDLYTGWELTGGPGWQSGRDMTQALRAMQL